MATDFGTIKTQVAQRIGDTSDAMKTIIGTYVNQRYKDVLRRSNWDIINYDYVVSATSASASYSLPANFGKELYVWDSVQLIDIPYASIEELEQQYQTEKNVSGTVENYSIFNTTTDLTEPSAARVKKIKFWRGIGASGCFEVPYTVHPINMSASSEILVFDCDRAVEYGATSDAWMYKRNFAKAQYYEALYEKEIQMLMFNQSNQPNQIPLFNPVSLNRDEGI